MRIDPALIHELHLRARRERAETLGRLIAAAFAWVVHHAPRPHLARQG